MWYHERGLALRRCTKEEVAHHRSTLAGMEGSLKLSKRCIWHTTVAQYSSRLGRTTNVTKTRSQVSWTGSRYITYNIGTDFGIFRHVASLQASDGNSVMQFFALQIMLMIMASQWTTFTFSSIEASIDYLLTFWKAIATSTRFVYVVMHTTQRALTVKRSTSKEWSMITLTVCPRYCKPRRWHRDWLLQYPTHLQAVKTIRLSYHAGAKTSTRLFRISSLLWRGA
jgi:hypothetical protein